MLFLCYSDEYICLGVNTFWAARLQTNQTTELMAVTSSNLDDFQNTFTIGKTAKFPTKLMLY